MINTCIMAEGSFKPSLRRGFFAIITACIILTAMYITIQRGHIVPMPVVPLGGTHNSHSLESFVEDISDTSESFMRDYKEQLEKARQRKMLYFDNQTVDRTSCPVEKQVVRAGSPDYFERMSNTSAETILLTTKYSMLRDSIRKDYFCPTSNDCSTLVGRSNFKPKNETGCKNDIIKQQECNLVKRDFNIIMKSDTDTPIATDDPILLNYIHIVNNGVVNSAGDVVFDNTRIVPNRCRSAHSTKVCRNNVKSYADEVFTISQFWAEGFFHSTMENLPRLLPYLTFLKTHSDIKIHVNRKNNRFFTHLGIPASRMITGTVKAGVLYMPTGTKCGMLPLFTGQLLSKALRKSMKPQNRTTIVLIRRSHKRYFKEHGSILQMLQKHATVMNLKVEVYPDNPLPSLASTVDVFNRAAIVIAPHGAGESNLILSQPGTVLIEGACNIPSGKMVLCYMTMARRLGIRYYGLAMNKHCFDTTAEDVEIPFLQYAELLGFRK